MNSFVSTYLVAQQRVPLLLGLGILTSNILTKIKECLSFLINGVLEPSWKKE